MISFHASTPIDPACDNEFLGRINFLAEAYSARGQLEDSDVDRAVGDALRELASEAGKLGVSLFFRHSEPFSQRLTELTPFLPSQLATGKLGVSLFFRHSEPFSQRLTELTPFLPATVNRTDTVSPFPDSYPRVDAP